MEAIQHTIYSTTEKATLLGTIFAQKYILTKEFKRFGYKALNAALFEIKQLHGRTRLIPIYLNNLTNQ